MNKYEQLRAELDASIDKAKAIAADKQLKDEVRANLSKKAHSAREVAHAVHNAITNKGEETPMEADLSNTCKFGQCINTMMPDSQFCNSHRCTQNTKAGTRCKSSVNCKVPHITTEAPKVEEVTSPATKDTTAWDEETRLLQLAIDPNERKSPPFVPPTEEDAVKATTSGTEESVTLNKKVRLFTINGFDSVDDGKNYYYSTYEDVIYVKFAEVVALTQAKESNPRVKCYIAQEMRGSFMGIKRVGIRKDGTWEALEGNITIIKSRYTK